MARKNVETAVHVDSQSCFNVCLTVIQRIHNGYSAYCFTVLSIKTLLSSSRSYRRFATCLHHKVIRKVHPTWLPPSCQKPKTKNQNQKIKRVWFVKNESTSSRWFRHFSPSPFVVLLHLTCSLPIGRRYGGVRVVQSLFSCRLTAKVSSAGRPHFHEC